MTSRLIAPRFRARRLRQILLCSAVVTMLAGPATAFGRQAASTSARPADMQLNVPAQALDSALTQVADQGATRIFFTSAELNGVRSSGVSGTMGIEQALSRALTGTGFTWRYREDRTIIVERAPVSQGAITLGPVRVEGAGGGAGPAQQYAVRDPGRTEGSVAYAAPATSTAFKIPLVPKETPQTVIVIPQAAIRDFNLTTVREVLEFTPGVFIRPERSRDYFDFQARGYDMQVQFDGVPSPNGMGGRGRSKAPDTAILDRVEVLQGASGLTSGAGAPGGIVNMFRKTPTSSAQLELQGGVDSWGGWRGVVDIGGPIGNSGLGGSFVAVLEKQPSYIDYVSGKHAVLYGVLEHKLGDATTVAAGFTLDKIFDYAPGSHYGFPTQAHGDLYPDIPRSHNWGPIWSDLEETGSNLFLRVQHGLADRWSVQALLTYEDFKTHSLQGSPYRERTEADWPTLVFGSQEESWNSENLSLDIAAQGEFTLFGRDHQLMFGFNGSLRDFGGASAGSAAPLTTVDPYHWDARQAPGAFSAGWNDYGAWTGKSENYGGYAGGRFELLKGVHALAGGRLSWYEQSFGGSIDSKDSAVFTPYGALTWDITKNVTAYANYTEIFQPKWVGTRDRDNHVLAPVTGQNKEIGLKISLFDDVLTAQGAVFWLDQVNVAEPDFAGEYPGVCGGMLDPCSRASGKSQAKGWDVSVAGEIFKGFQVLAGYSRVENDGEGLKERVASRLDRVEAAAGRRMTRGTSVLATIGATAPFVGLFGTVWGIMNAFIGISASQTTNLAVVAPGIAEALLATAMGLVAAIPAVVIYNHFARLTAAYRALVGDTSAAVLRLVSRDFSSGILGMRQLHVAE